MEKRMPAAMSVRKLATNKRLWLAVVVFSTESTISCDFFGFLAHAFDVHLLIATKGAEVEDQKQVADGHGRGHQRGPFQRSLSAVEHSFVDRSFVHSTGRLRACPPSREF